MHTARALDGGPRPGRRPPVPNQLFLGTFVHSVALDRLEYLHDWAVCVEGRSGKIVATGTFKHRQRAEDELFAKLGWHKREVAVVESGEGGFFFPGFIGECALPCQSLSRCCTKGRHVIRAISQSRQGFRRP